MKTIQPFKRNAMGNPWHDVEPGKPDELPECFDAIIEIPKGGSHKYELDKVTGLLRLDRVLYSAVHYPANYGFIPQTLGDDGDPLDVLVLGAEPVVPLTLVAARAIGVIRMKDTEEVDDKIIAVHVNDPEYSSYHGIQDLPEHRLMVLQRFFEDYKILERKKVVVEEIQPAENAYPIIKRGIDLYRRWKAGEDVNPLIAKR